MGASDWDEERNNLAGPADREARFDRIRWFGQTILRHSQTQDGFRERLALFWGDHFTAQGKSGLVKLMGAPYVETAIRPHMSGTLSLKVRNANIVRVTD